jgi:putative glycosyltransferase (TIGR04372 family)
LIDQTPYLGNASGRFFTDVGSRADRPFKILAPITTLSFGDAFIFTSVATRIAAAFEYSHCRFLVDHSRPYLRDITSFHPFSSAVDVIDTDWRALPFAALAGPTRTLDWREPAYHDLVVTSVLQSSSQFADLPRCSLMIPDALTPSLTETLSQMGLVDDNWFCVIHWREPNYEYKAVANARDVDPRRYLPLIDHIIDVLDGQVVLCGHPEMTRPAAREGLVDLAGLENSWMLQAFATSRARFFAGSPSGATCMAHAFLIPSAHLDVLDWCTGCEDDWVVTPTVHLHDGRNLRQDDLFESGWMLTARITEALQAGEKITLTQCDTQEMFLAIEQLFRDTSDVQGWRSPEPPPLDRPNRLLFPPTGGSRPRFLPLA